MSLEFLILLCFGYLIIIFGAAYLAGHHKKWKTYLSNNSLVYALSLGVYCTAWTFYGSVGQASKTGLGYLGVYLGPTLIAPFWIYFLKKIIRISKYLRITSVADFVSSRYGKSTLLGVLVSILCIFIVIPYISIQLKALDFSFKLLQANTSSISPLPFYKDPLILFSIVFTFFAIFFGTRKLDPSEKHPGVVSVIALESIFKLIAFLIGALTIIFGVFNGFEDLFNQAKTVVDLKNLSILTEEGLNYQSWFWIMLLSAFAFMFLPRQFHMAVVENNRVSHLKEASWITPLYLFLISFLVLPVALAGVVLFGNSVEPDTFLLSIPISKGYSLVAVIVFMGGLAAISGMIMTSTISMSIMISNNIFLPLLLRVKNQYDNLFEDLNTRLLQLRRLLIVVVILLSYGFYKGFSINYSIVSVGLISFAGIAQLAPAIFLGLYWKSVTAKGAIAGFIVGVFLWAFTLPFANAVELGIVNTTVLNEGLFGIAALNPKSLFGLDGMGFIAHGAFWSIITNFVVTVSVSLFTKRSPLEIAQSDVFLYPEKYYRTENKQTSAIIREARFEDLQSTIISILGETKFESLLKNYFRNEKTPKDSDVVDSKFIDHLENYLSGSIGTASAKIVLNNLVVQKPVDTEELLKVLDQTFQVYQYSQLLEKQRTKLNKTTKDLQEANNKLLQLDNLKNEFLSNVTHELRTPITSIRSLATILKEYEVSPEEKDKFLSIINEESERISDLVNQVLDLRKMEVKSEIEPVEFDLPTLIHLVIDGLTEIAENRSIELMTTQPLMVFTDKRKLKQILVNLLSNAIKFTDNQTGKISIFYSLSDSRVTIVVRDNGIGISENDVDKVFDRFYQVKNSSTTKTKGSGLGLAISKKLAESLEGNLTVKSKIGKGSEFIICFPHRQPG